LLIPKDSIASLRTVSRSPVRRQGASELPGIRVATHILLAASEAPAGCAIDTIRNEPDQGGVNTTQPKKDTTMRLFVLSALAVTAFVSTMTFEPSNANAVVYCASGVVRAGCVVRPVVAPVARAVARPGVPGNRGGPVNRVGRR
jgi:hypothetical protein